MKAQTSKPYIWSNASYLSVKKGPGRSKIRSKIHFFHLRQYHNKRKGDQYQQGIWNVTSTETFTLLTFFLLTFEKKIELELIRFPYIVFNKNIFDRDIFLGFFVQIFCSAFYLIFFFNSWFSTDLLSLFQLDSVLRNTCI